MKKTLIQNTVKCVAFLLILGVMLWGLNLVFRPKDNTDEAGMHFVRTRGYLAEPENTLDVLFLGDSEVYGAYSPLELWAQAGFTTYDCASGAQSLDESYNYLLEATAHQKPKLVVIEGLTVVRKMSINDTIFTEAARAFPILSHHDRWKSLQFSDLTQQVNYTNQETLKGYRARWKYRPAKDGEYMKKTDKYKELPLINQIFMARILHYCAQRDIQVMIIASPSTKNWNYTKHNTIQRFAQANGIPFVDLNLVTEEIGINNKTDWRDGGDHLNLFGGTKVSRYLAPLLAQQYQLPDHRDDEAYAPWDEALAEYREEYAAAFEILDNPK